MFLLGYNLKIVIQCVCVGGGGEVGGGGNENLVGEGGDFLGGGYEQIFRKPCTNYICSRVILNFILYTITL